MSDIPQNELNDLREDLKAAYKVEPTYEEISEAQIKYNTKLFADSSKNREILNQIHKVRAEVNKLEGLLK